MANRMKRIVSLVIAVIWMVAGMITSTAFAAKDSSQTHLYYKAGGKAPFTKMDIVVTINGSAYYFTESGNNSWKNATEIGELGLPSGGSVDVIIVVASGAKEGAKYSAKLVNHSSANGNNGNNGNRCNC